MSKCGGRGHLILEAPVAVQHDALVRLARDAIVPQALAVLQDFARPWRRRLVGNALVGEPVREITRWKNRKNPSPDDVPVLQVTIN